MPKTVLAIIPEGFEEIEAVTPINLMRRAGIEVTTASLSEGTPTGKVGITIHTDTTLNDIEDPLYDCLFLPGGPGTQNLLESEYTIDLIKKHHEAGKIIAAICAAPLALDKTCILDGRRYTAHFTVQDKLPNISEENVVVDGNIITSRGAGTAIPFALEIISQLAGKDSAEETARSICYE